MGGLDHSSGVYYNTKKVSEALKNLFLRRKGSAIRRAHEAQKVLQSSTTMCQPHKNSLTRVTIMFTWSQRLRWVHPTQCWVYSAAPSADHWPPHPAVRGRKSSYHIIIITLHKPTRLDLWISVFWVGRVSRAAGTEEQPASLVAFDSFCLPSVCSTTLNTNGAAHLRALPWWLLTASSDMVSEKRTLACTLLKDFFFRPLILHRFM